MNWKPEFFIFKKKPATSENLAVLKELTNIMVRVQQLSIEQMTEELKTLRVN